jgi:A/G-specific adenine glycosylase
MKRGSNFSFSRILLGWNQKNNSRQMPWKGEKDPYKIWLSEIILQQTRVEQGIKYYLDFLKAFPTIQKLANAPDQKIYKQWEGLGYYTRCKNLIHTARYLSQSCHGKFPGEYEEIKKLKGIGPYTAAAIASFAFDEPHAVVDGNVFRVLARLYGIRKPIDSTEGKKYFSDLANQLLDKKNPGLYNQAIMDFGAVICKPVPLCEDCPFNQYCYAYHKNKISHFPVKLKKTLIRKRWFYYIILENNGRVAIRKREANDIWHNLFEFLLVESAKELVQDQITREAEKLGLLEKNSFSSISCTPVFHQQLSHQLIESRFIKIALNKKSRSRNDLTWVRRAELRNYPFPRLINRYLENEKL